MPTSIIHGNINNIIWFKEVSAIWVNYKLYCCILLSLAFFNRIYKTGIDTFTILFVKIASESVYFCQTFRQHTDQSAHRAMCENLHALSFLLFFLRL